MTEVIFKNKILNELKLIAYGFEKCKNGYLYLFDIIEGQLCIRVEVSLDGRMYTEVFDKITNDEYILHRVPEAEGSFVGRVRQEYENLLDKIFLNCFDSEGFEGQQAKEIIAYVRHNYGDELEFLWQKFPKNAVFRRNDNQKWYAAILTISIRKLGIDSNEKREIIDLRMKPENIEKMVDRVKYFPGYHMNKKHWVTICLDDSVSTSEIIQRINESYELAKK